MRARFALAWTLVAALGAACAESSADSVVERPSPRASADSIVAALSTHDMRRLSVFAHPTRGVRFSPYAYVDTTSDHVVAAGDVAGLWADAAPVVWGAFDGTGDPIRLTYADFHRKFVYDADFLHAPSVAVDSQPIGRGNTTNNIVEVYPGASIVEYHWPGRDPSLSGMDWRSLWIVLEPDGNRWRLVGVVHGAWTI